MIGELLAGLMSGLGVAAESSAQGAATNLGYANLFETKRSNRKKEQLATSSRTDARGNKVFYDPDLGWQIQLDPETAKILDAEDKETLLSLTDDATRNRDATIRQDKRSKMGDEEFERNFNEYKYRPQKSEDAYIGDAQQELLSANRKAGDKVAADTNRALIRQGNSSNVPAVFKAARDEEAAGFADALLSGKRQGQQDFLNIEGGKDKRAQDELGFLEAIAGKTTNMPQNFTNRADTLTGTADSALQELLQTLAGNDSARQGAMQTLMSAVGKSPDFAPLASAMGKFGGSLEGAATGHVATTTGRDIPYPRPYEEGVRARLRAGF